MNKIIKKLSEWAWYPCYKCGWPLPDGASICPQCGQGQ